MLKSNTKRITQYVLIVLEYILNCVRVFKTMMIG